MRKVESKSLKIVAILGLMSGAVVTIWKANQ